MTISDVLFRHLGHDLASPNEIIPIFYQINNLVDNSDK